MAGQPNGGSAARFADVARSLQTAATVDELLQQVVVLAVDVIDGCDHAGITLVSHDQITTAASSDPVVVEVDRIQSETGEGPCIDAIRKHATFESPDLSKSQEWPNFVRRVAATGVRSMLGIRLFVADDTMGALDLFSETVCGFDENARQIAEVFATHASIALAAAAVHDRDFHSITGLGEALTTRDVIGQAKGILMATRKISADDAFILLRRASQDANVKLRTIAEDVVTAGELPTP